jgi:hypothetical protein
MKNAWRVVLALLTVATVTTTAAAQTAAPEQKAAPAGKAMTVQGKVTSATGDSLTVAKGSESMTFTVDGTTKIIGKGLTTKTNEKAAEGKKMTLSDAVGAGDMVTVTYHDMGGTMHASQVKVTQKALSTK